MDEKREVRQAGGRARASARIIPLALALTFSVLAGCDGEDPVLPPNLRFGQIGMMRMELLRPLGVPDGEHRQRISWTSEGSWHLDESILYRGIEGTRIERAPESGGAAFASAYATVISQVNDTPGLRLFYPELDPELDPDCGPSNSRVLFEMEDLPRQEAVRWVRCAPGTLAELRPQGAGPDLDAARVIAAAVAVRDLTIGTNHRSPLLGTLPFGTLDQGEDSGVALEGSLIFRPVNGGPPPSWITFWDHHTRGENRIPPEVNWREDMVIVGAVGRRNEAGSTVSVRRVLQTADGAVVELVEKIPAHFCSPASRLRHPYHVVTVPLTPSAIFFRNLESEEIPCGS